MLSHAIGRVTICLFIVGVVGGVGYIEPGSIAQAQGSNPGRLIEPIFKIIDEITKKGGYISVKGGMSTAVDGDVLFPTISYARGEAEGYPLDGSINTKMAPVYSVALGGRARWGRLEGEFSYRENKIRDFNFKQPIGQIQGEGGLENLAVMMNLLYDLKGVSFTIKSTTLTPYLVGGLGVSYVKYTEEKLLGAIEEGCRGCDFESVKHAERKLMLAYQGGAGIRYEIWDNFNLDISYRWFGTPEVEFVSMEGSGEATELTFKNTHHTGMVGLVLDF